MCLAARTHRGSLSDPPDPLATIGGGVLLLRGRERERGEKGRGCIIFISLLATGLPTYYASSDNKVAVAAAVVVN